MGKTRELEVRVAEKEELLRRKLEEAKKLEEQLKQLNNKKKAEDNKKRTHRLIEIGGAVESVLGHPIEHDDLPRLIAYLKNQDSKGGYFTRAMGYEYVSEQNPYSTEDANDNTSNNNNSNQIQ